MTVPPTAITARREEMVVVKGREGDKYSNRSYHIFITITII